MYATVCHLAASQSIETTCCFQSIETACCFQSIETTCCFLSHDVFFVSCSPSIWQVSRQGRRQWQRRRRLFSFSVFWRSSRCTPVGDDNENEFLKKEFDVWLCLVALLSARNGDDDNDLK